MKKITFALLFLSTSLMAQINTPKEAPTRIELSGFFYQYLPYHLKFPSNKTALSFDSKYVNYEETKSLDSTHTVIRFNPQERQYGYFTVHDSINNSELHMEIRTRQAPLTFTFRTEDGRYNSGDALTLKSLQEAQDLLCRVQSFDVDWKLPVKNFDLVIIKDKQYENYSSNGARISRQQLKVFNEVKGNTMIVFDNIVVKYGEGEVQADPFILFVIEEFIKED